MRSAQTGAKRPVAKFAASVGSGLYPMVFRWHGLSFNPPAMKMFAPILFLMTLSLSVLPLAAERINQEGRILGPLPVVTRPVLFNTNDADAVVSAMQIFPVTNPWNECISNRPLLANSDAMIAQINSDVDSSHRK